MSDINWSKIVMDLNKHMSLQAIADKVGLSLQATHNLKSGQSKEPMGTVGVRLFNFHKMEMERQDKIAALNKRLEAKHGTHNA